MKKFLFLLFLLFNVAVFADEGDIKAMLIKQLTGVISNIEKADIKKTPIANLYEITLGAEIIYASKDGRFLIRGNILDIKNGYDLTDIRKKQLAVKLIDTVAEADKIIFKADKEKYFIHVFTDVDCPYCRKLHRQVPALNKLGVSVKYMASPLAQLHPKAFATMQSIWCAKDRNAAMDHYKKTKQYTQKSCNSNAVAEQLVLAQNLGVSGTPSIFLSDGSKIAGAVPTKELFNYIRKAKPLSTR